MSKHSTPARAALKAQQSKLEKMLSEADTLQRRAESFRVNVASYTNDAHIEAMAERRRELMGEVALGERPLANLDHFDNEMVEAQQKYREGRREAEIASAGAARLQAQHTELAADITVLSKQLPGLQYAAALEILHARFEPVTAALQGLVTAYQGMAAAALAVDGFADPAAGRTFTIGRLGNIQGFGVPTPELEGLDAATFGADIDRKAVATQAAQILAELSA